MGLFLAGDNDARLPVAVLTGFLGSGKTTLLNRLLRHPDMRDTAVVINEIGEVGLDQYFLDEADSDVVMLSNGCLCCVVRDELEDTVSRIYARRNAGELPAFVRLIIETTGLADPAPVVEGFLSNPVLSRCFRLSSVTATVDAVHIERHLDAYFESVRQVAVADRLVVTKADLADDAALQRVEDRIRRINPGAVIQYASERGIEPGDLFGAGLFDLSGRNLNVEAWMGQGACAALDHAHDHGHRDHRHERRVASFTVVIDRPIAWRAFSDWLRTLRIRRGDNLLRIKGILNLTEEDRPVAIHGVHHILHPPTSLREWPWPDRKSRIVFVTCDLERSEIEAGLETALAARTSSSAVNAPEAA